MQIRDIKTLTMLGCQTIGRSDGRAAILLNSKELGPVAFEVNEQAIDAIQKALAVAATLLHRSENPTRN